jgi:phage terminase large subunit-like protein
VLYKNETKHVVELAGTKQGIRAKTAWNADTLRGDYSDCLFLDEYQLMNEDTWALVGAPMLLDNDGDAVFIYTPPSLRTISRSKACDPRHASKLFKQAAADTTGRWQTFHFTSHDNPHLSKTALDEIAGDMTNLAYRQEILAEEIEDNPGALWNRDMIEAHRCTRVPDMARVVVAVDVAATSNEQSAETGIIVAGRGVDGDFYVLDDVSLRDSPLKWASAAVVAFHRNKADRIVAEINNGGDMVESTLRTVEGNIPFRGVHASRGKQVRAEPIAALYEQGKAHHFGVFAELEDQ